MKLLIGIWLGAGIMCILFLCVLVYYNKTKKQIGKINDMLDRALMGEFQERCYDESYLSALETKMYQYLTSYQRKQDNLQAERDTIKTLIGDISHQTKTPIANLKLYGQLLQEQSDSFSKEANFLVNELLAQTEKLDFLIQSLIKLSRLETGIIVLQPEENSIKDLLIEVMESLSVKARQKNITVTSELLNLSGVFDWKWTAEAIGNILDNSIKYTPEGGVITITMTEYPSFCRIDIADNGMGIAEEEIPKIFGRFYRSPSVKNEEGCGIGLYLARTIIHRQYGYIKAASQVEKGSVFSVLITKAFAQGTNPGWVNKEDVFAEEDENKGNPG